MSDVPGATAATAVSAGALLREARERAGVHIGALAVGLKVPVKKIEALEADRLDLLPDAVFARALASSIARTLKTDPAPILAALPQSRVPGLAASESVIRVVGDTTAMTALAPFLAILRKPAVLFGGLLVIAALALVFVPAPETRSSNPALPVSTGLTPGGVSSGPDATATPANGSPVELPMAAQSQTSSMASPQSDAQTGGIKTATPVEAQRLANTTVSAAPSASVKGSDAGMVLGAGVEVQAKPGIAGLILLTASGVTWVEVTDAEGIVQLRKTLSPGENASAGGVLPLKVVVGRVNATQVQVRGKPYDIAPFGKDNVARFEVR